MKWLLQNISAHRSRRRAWWKPKLLLSWARSRSRDREHCGMAFCEIDAGHLNATIFRFWCEKMGCHLKCPRVYTHHRTLQMSAQGCKKKSCLKQHLSDLLRNDPCCQTCAFSCAIHALLGRDGMYIGKVAKPIRAWDRGWYPRASWKWAAIYQFEISMLYVPNLPSSVLFARRCWCLYFDLARAVGTSGGAASWLNMMD